MKIGIAGAGISGLATAQALRASGLDPDILVFEAADRAGGKVMTEATPEGYLCEWGVNAFLDKSPRTLELCQEVGVQPLPADASAKKRYVFSQGRLHKLPEKPGEFLFSGLLSLPGKLRVLGEIFTGPAGQTDETLEQFGTRHLGREAFEKLIDPMASGVFAGDARRMSLKSCFPRIHEVEAGYGSLIRGLISLQREARRSASGERPGPGPGGTLTSFEQGMSVLTDTLAAGLGPDLRLGAAVEGISFTSGRYTLHGAAGWTEEFDRVLLAAPAWAQARILADLDPVLAKMLNEIPYPPLAVVCMGFERERMGDGMDGFGFLVPSGEKRGILGTVVDSNVFPNRAPPGKVLLRTMVGGARRPGLAELPDERLQDLVLEELADIMGVKPQPEYVQIHRHEKAIPQYLLGHADRLEALDERLKKFPGLVLGGNAFRGVSLNDCVLNGMKAASTLLGRAGNGAE